MLLRAEVFLINSCDLCGNFEYRKPIIYDNFFVLPPFPWPRDLSDKKKVSLPTKNVKTECGVEFVTQKFII